VSNYWELRPSIPVNADIFHKKLIFVTSPFAQKNVYIYPSFAKALPAVLLIRHGHYCKQV